MDSTRLHIDSGSSRFRFFSFFLSIPSGPEVCVCCQSFCLCAVCSLMGREKLPLMYVFLFFEKKNTKINLLIYMSSYMDASLCDVHVCLWCLAVTSFLGQTKIAIFERLFWIPSFFSTTAYGFGQMQIMVIVWLLYYIIFWSFLGSTISSPSLVFNLIISLSLSTVKLKAQNYYQLWVVTCEYEKTLQKNLGWKEKKRMYLPLFQGE